jgi:hypothetical protein
VKPSRAKAMKKSRTRKTNKSKIYEPHARLNVYFRLISVRRGKIFPI